MILRFLTKPAIYVNITDIYTESCPIAMDGFSQTNDKIAYSNDDLRLGMELLFYAYRDFIGPPDEILREHRLGRAHHRVIHFVGRNPGITVSDLLSILRITKQSLSRVLSDLLREGIVQQDQGTEDRRQRLLTLSDKGRAFEIQVSQSQRDRIAASFASAGPEAVEGFRKVLLGMISDPAVVCKFQRKG